MENLKLLGLEVKSMKQAIKILGCTKSTLDFSMQTVIFNGITFSLFLYKNVDSDKFCYSATAVNLESKQFI